MLKHWTSLPRSSRWTIGGIAAVVLIVAISWALFVPVADWLTRQDVGSNTGSLHETAVDNARGRLLTLGAGLVAAGALVFTSLNFNLLRRNSEQTDQWQRRTYELTEQGQVTDRYTKAIEQLGSDKLDVRIGGIYALERIARDSARDHPTVLEVLTAFIREHSHEQWPTPGADGAEPKRLTRPDVQAAINVIKRRDAGHDAVPIDLTRADLTRADLTEADLTDVGLTGAHLDDADLSGTYLTSADLEGAHLTGTYLYGTYFTAADLTGADLTGAHLIEAYLDYADLTNANLTGAHLAFTDLTGAHLIGARLIDADLSHAVLDDVLLGGADLTGAQLDGAKWPADLSVPEGWTLDPDSGALKRICADSGSTEAD